MTRRRLSICLAALGFAMASCAGSTADGPVDEAIGTLANTDVSSTTAADPTTTERSLAQTTTTNSAPSTTAATASTQPAE
ncbi:MAG: hypothetical protein ACN4GZ_20150, partial [Acidimicrobiales bacterium]